MKLTAYIFAIVLLAGCADSANKSEELAENVATMESDFDLSDLQNSEMRSLITEGLAGDAVAELKATDWPEAVEISTLSIAADLNEGAMLSNLAGAPKGISIPDASPPMDLVGETAGMSKLFDNDRGGFTIPVVDVKPIGVDQLIGSLGLTLESTDMSSLIVEGNDLAAKLGVLRNY